VDWTLFHAVNSGVATRDWLEDPATALAGVLVPLYALATVGLWFLARPYGPVRWKLASASALVAAAVALLANGRSRTSGSGRGRSPPTPP
jgi:hypothetical protein